MDSANDTPGARLTVMINQALGADTTAGVSLTVHTAANGGSITLDCATGVCLSDAADQAVCAARLLELCTGFDDPDLRIGLTGEYDDVHLFKSLPTAELAATDLIDAAAILLGRAGGLQGLVSSKPQSGSGQRTT